jgi:hypothetical protein
MRLMTRSVRKPRTHVQGLTTAFRPRDSPAFREKPGLKFSNLSSNAPLQAKVIDDLTADSDRHTERSDRDCSGR